MWLDGRVVRGMDEVGRENTLSISIFHLAPFSAGHQGVPVCVVGDGGGVFSF